MDPSQNDVLAAELLRLQKAGEARERSKATLMQLMGQQAGRGGAAAGSSGASAPAFNGGVNLPTTDSLSNAGALFDSQRANDFMLSQSVMNNLGTGMSGVTSMSNQNGDAGAGPNHPPMLVNNNMNSVSNNPGVQDSSPSMMNNQFAPQPQTSARIHDMSTYDTMHRSFMDNILLRERARFLMASSRPQEENAANANCYNLDNMYPPTLLPGINAIQQTMSNKQDDPGWEEQFKALRQYHLQFGHCKVPARFKPNSKLGRWVMTQRRQFTLLMQGLPSALTAERIRRLDSIGFTWQVRPAPATTWNKKFEELKAYKTVNGNCMVPQRYHANLPLGTWVHTQRRQYKLMKDGKQNSMTREKMDALRSVGFNWDAKFTSSSAATPDKND